MKKEHWIIPLTALTLGLSACGSDEAGLDGVGEDTAIEEMPETSEEDAGLTENEQSEADTEEDGADRDTEETAEREDYYQERLDKARQEYAAGELDAASGTLSRLLKADLTSHPTVQSEGEELKQEIHDQQSQQAQETAQVLGEQSTYQEERQSALLAEEYMRATGESIDQASDEELEGWFEDREGQAEAGEADDEREWTKEEAESYAFDQLLIREDLDYDQYFFFVNLTEEDWVQIEAREAVEQDGVTWSNLIGLYRYNVSTDELEKLDSVTGDFYSLD
ncbi:hypothetical protein ADIAL_0822 [Alkalibacterium sp. AK22]|uniref:hypothetical protein n=1 Tax=Alkalibacterium sp. AK22 TaxID=1229520 RepID=UPI00044C556A|nr:hypothetical protein [Alkalibacterium sp. AK22]EXJ23707.1 hypothetical protein ADIAL_0822 [Alkalibacterium sp. AK22]